MRESAVASYERNRQAQSLTAISDKLSTLKTVNYGKFKTLLSTLKKA